LFPPERRTQATALLIIVINVLGGVVGPLAAGIVSDLLDARFGQEALRISLLAMSTLTLIGGLIYLRASTYYQQDAARAAA
jgi:MFS family permease